MNLASALMRRKPPTLSGALAATPDPAVSFNAGRAALLTFVLGVVTDLRGQVGDECSLAWLDGHEAADLDDPPDLATAAYVYGDHARRLFDPLLEALHAHGGELVAQLSTPPSAPAGTIETEDD